MATRYAMTRFLKSSSIVLLLSPEIGIAFTRAEPRTLSNTVESGSATFTNGRIDLIPFDKLRVSFPPGHPAGIRAEALFLAVRLNGKKSMTLFAQALFAIGFGNRVAAAVCFNLPLAARFPPQSCGTRTRAAEVQRSCLSVPLSSVLPSYEIKPFIGRPRKQESIRFFQNKNKKRAHREEKTSRWAPASCLICWGYSVCRRCGSSWFSDR